MPHDRSLTPATVSLVLLCGVLWGGTVVAIRYSVDELPPVGTAGIRFALAAVFMFFWCRWERGSLKIRPGQGVPIVVAGLILFVQISILHIGAALTSTAHGALILNIYPVFVAILAHFLFVDDRLTLRKCLGLTAAMLGVLLIVLAAGGSGPAADQSSLLGDLLIFGSALLLAVKTVYIKRVLPRIEVSKLLFWHDILAVTLFMLTSFLFEGFENYHFTTVAVVGLLYQGIIVAGFCFAAWTWLLRHHRASQLAVFMFVTPLTGVVLSNVMRGDPITAWLLAGGAAIAVGVYLVSSSAR